VGLFPCAAHGAFFKGAAEAAYPSLVMGKESEREHQRLCHECFSSLIALCEEKLSEAVVGEKPPAFNQRVCAMCGGAAGRASLFVTVYPRGEEPRNFFGAVCDRHVDAARAAWLRLEGPVIAQ
jgi:hypothetical protein